MQCNVFFNDKFRLGRLFSAFEYDFSKISFRFFKPESKARLWDSIAFSCNEIYLFRKDIDGNEIYNNATSRIIVFTSGEDFGSLIKLEKLIKEFERN